jgi:Protein of unknown function (DUF3237)
LVRLDYLMTYQVRLAHPMPVAGPGPFGRRVWSAVDGGWFDGPGLRGRVEAGADWGVFDAEGTLHLDAKVLFLTEDGAGITGSYFGILKSVDGTPAIKPGAGTRYGEQYFMTSPRFETGDPRYAWLNDLVCVAEGRQLDDGVEYRVHAVQSDLPG